MHSIGTIISTNRKQQNMSQTELAEALNTRFGYNISNKSISKWENDSAAPDIRIFFDLCRLLGVSDPYGAYFGSFPCSPLSRLNERGMEKVYDYASLLCKDEQYLKTSDPSVQPARTSHKSGRKIVPFRTIPLQLYPVSAGPGNFLDDENYEDMAVDDDVPMSADFAVRVSGDSMEPLLHRNQIIYVHRQDTLENGELGIFFLNGEAYVKRFQKDEHGTFLISLNRQYQPMPVTEDSNFRIFGRLVF